MDKKTKETCYTQVYRKMKDDSEVSGLGYPEVRKNYDFYCTLRSFNVEFSLNAGVDLLRMTASREFPDRTEDELVRMGRELTDGSAVKFTAYDNIFSLSLPLPLPGIKDDEALRRAVGAADMFVAFIKEKFPEAPAPMAVANTGDVSVGAPDGGPEDGSQTDVQEGPVARPEKQSDAPEVSVTEPDVPPVRQEMPDDTQAGTVPGPDGSHGVQETPATHTVTVAEPDVRPDVQGVALPDMAAGDVSPAAPEAEPVAHRSADSTSGDEEDMLDEVERILGEMESQMGQREEALGRQKAELEERERRLAEKESELARRETSSRDRDAYLRKEVASLREEKDAFRKEKESLEKERLDFKKEVGGQDDKARELRLRERKLAIREREVKLLRKSADGRDASLAEREAAAQAPSTSAEDVGRAIRENNEAHAKEIAGLKAGYEGKLRALEEKVRALSERREPDMSGKVGLLKEEADALRAKADELADLREGRDITDALGHMGIQMSDDGGTFSAESDGCKLTIVPGERVILFSKDVRRVPGRLLSHLKDLNATRVSEAYSASGRTVTCKLFLHAGAEEPVRRVLGEFSEI